MSATLLLVLTGCAGRGVPQLESNELFRLGYGKLEGQLDLFRENLVSTRKTRMVMSDGLFFVSNGPSNKIMEFTSYGDLISLYYNSQENPRPVSVRAPGRGEQLLNRTATSYPFVAAGELAVTSDKTVLVEDRVPDRVAVYDEELGVKLNRVVVRFDPESDQVDYLGQEGIGGSYLPYIQRIDVTNNDHIVVVTVAPPQWLIFWYDRTGRLLRRITISSETLPVPGNVEVVPVVESIMPDRERLRLYLKMNYYVQARDSETGARFGIDEVFSRVYWMNIESGVYEGYVAVPRNTRYDEMRDRTDEFYYELLGTAPGEHLFLLSQVDANTSELMILHTGGRVVRRREIELDYSEVLYRDLFVSPTGILCGMVANAEYATVQWWRTDKLFANEAQ
jgi:hypothetical protein